MFKLQQIALLLFVYTTVFPVNFFSGSSIDIQHDVLYKTKFITAVRLWRKQDEEKRVCLDFYSSTCLILDVN